MEKDWRARFELDASKPTIAPKLFSRAALLIASVYSVLVTWALIETSRTGDAESVTVGWSILGPPWVFAVGHLYWLAIPLNALTVYILVILGLAVCRAAFKS